MNRTTKIIGVAIAILAILALIGWLGYDNYQQQQQLGAMANYQTKIEGEGKVRYDQKLNELKDRGKGLEQQIAALLEKLDKGQLLAENKEALRQQLLDARAALQTANAQLDTAYYGSGVPEDALDRFASAAMGYLSDVAEASQKDSELTKQRLQYYQSKLRAYRDSMDAYIKERQMLVESLQMLEEQLSEAKKGRAELKGERDRLLERLGEKDAALDSLMGDDSEYARNMRRFEDSLNSLANRNQPMYARELRCYYTPRQKTKRGHVMLNEQPIHSPKNIREILLEFEADIIDPASDSKVEVVMLKEDVPVKSWDVITADQRAVLRIDCQSEKLEPGNYSFQIKYMGETVRTHKFKVTK